jgi:hypothetical protein
MSFFSIPTLRAFPIAIAAGCTYTTSTDANTIILLHGENFTDYSLTGYTITNTNVIINSSSPTKFCNNFYFNSSNSSYFTLPNLSSVFTSTSTGFTVEMWIYITATPTSNVGIVNPINNQGLAWFIRTDGKMQFSNNITGPSPVGTTALSINAWHHIAAVSNGTYTNIYLDGNLDIGDPFNTTGFSAQMYVGRPTGGAAAYLQGYIDEFRVSNTIRYSGSTYTVPTTTFA